MKRTIVVPLLLALAACEHIESPQGELDRGLYETVEHGMIQLGEKLDDPYTLENMRNALTKVYPTKADRLDISVTDLYARFLPKDEAELKALQELGLYLMDHPMDYRIVKEGDYYQDPEVGEEAITWQYAVVPHDFSFPEGIRYEVLDECYIAEHDPVTRAASDIDWNLVEREAFRLTGNEGMLSEETKGGGAVAPAGRITIEDPGFSGGKPFGVAGVKVAANIFVKIATTYTDRDGYYRMGTTFRGDPRYRLVFQNEKGFKIGFNFIIIPASVSTLGRGSHEGIDLNIQAGSDDALFRRCAVNNATYDFYSRCTETDLGIAPPPDDLRIWIFPSLDCSSASMLHHGAFLDHALLVAYLGVWIPVIQLFLPDITLGTKEQDYAGIYKIVSHELSHASHFQQVGSGFWTPYVQYIIRSYVTEGQDPYGTGTSENAGYCEVGEMWGYFMQETLYKDHYGGTLGSFGNQFWFKPDIFSYLYERGMSRAEIYRALTKDVCDANDLKEELISRYPDREGMIEQVFTTYGRH